MVATPRSLWRIGLILALALSAAAAGGIRNAIPAHAAAITLYDQLNNDNSNGLSSTNDSSNAAYTAQGADDFVVPAGGWYISRVDFCGEDYTGGGLSSFNIYFYQDGTDLNGDHVPGALIASATAQPFTSGADPACNGGDTFYSVTGLNFSLPAGTDWISIQANSTNFFWLWQWNLVVTNNSAAFQNPGDGFFSGCVTWMPYNQCGESTPTIDFMFRLVGNLTAPDTVVTAGHAYTGLTEGVQRTAIVGHMSDPDHIGAAD
jgi:hypothetical protein